MSNETDNTLLAAEDQNDYNDDLLDAFEDLNGGAASDVGAGADTGADADTGAVPDAGTGTDPDANAGAGADTDPDAGTGTDVGAGAGADDGANAGDGAGVDDGAGASDGAGVDDGAGAGASAGDPDAGAVPDAGTGTDAGDAVGAGNGEGAAAGDSNRPPVIGETEVPDQTVNPASPFYIYRVPATAFSDPDHDQLTYSAELADGGELPSWLSFDVRNKTFWGFPPKADRGSLDIRIIATDPSKASVYQDFKLTVGTNDAPVVADPIDDVHLANGGIFIFRKPTGAFSDPDGDALQVSTAPTNAEDIPDWLFHDVGNDTWYGIVPTTGSGSFTLKATATDTGGLSVEDEFVVNWGADTNRAPEVVNDITDMKVGVNSPVIIRPSFTDPDGDKLTYSLTVNGSAAMPEWLNYDTTNHVLYGFPPTDGVYDFAITATDPKGLTATDEFKLTVGEGGVPPEPPLNNPPVVKDEIPDFTNVKSGMVMDLPAAPFYDEDGDDLEVKLTLADGEALPSWMKINDDGDLVAEVPASEEGKTLKLKMTATDPDGATAEQEFDISFYKPASDEPKAPLVNEDVPDFTGVAVGKQVTLDLPNKPFTDPENQALTLKLLNEDGTPAPYWMSLNAEGDIVVTDAPASLSGKTEKFKLMATDPTMLEATQDFSISFAATENRPPVVKQEIPDKMPRAGSFYYYSIANGFSDPDKDKLTYAVSMADGSEKPKWIGYVDALKSIYVNAPLGTEGWYNVRVTATDPSGASAYQDVMLKFGPKPADPPASTQQADALNQAMAGSDAGAADGGASTPIDDPAKAAANLANPA